jgi:hypothetical protein
VSDCRKRASRCREGAQQRTVAEVQLLVGVLEDGGVARQRLPLIEAHACAHSHRTRSTTRTRCCPVHGLQCCPPGWRMTERASREDAVSPSKSVLWVPPSTNARLQTPRGGSVQ